MEKLPSQHVVGAKKEKISIGNAKKKISISCNVMSD
jgi:hypothetical protein